MNDNGKAVCEVVAGCDLRRALALLTVTAPVAVPTQ
jgi:hypothetical protein